MDDLLTFDENTHTYFWNGKKVPCVTDVLDSVKYCDYSQIPDAVRELAMERGSEVHACTQSLDKGVLKWDSMDPLVAPYVEGYGKFKKDTGFVPEIIEKRIYSRDFNFAGTLDRIGILNNQLILLDYKTGSAIPKWVPIQTAAYQHLANTLKIYPTCRYALLLKKDGTYSLSEPYTDYIGDFAAFTAGLVVYNKKLELGIAA